MADSTDLALRGSPGPAETTTKSAERFSFWEKGQKQVLFSVLKIRGYKVLYLRMDLSQPMTCLCGNRQIFISQIHHQESIHQNASAASSCFLNFLGSLKSKSLYTTNLVNVFSKPSSIPSPLFCHPTMPNVLPTHRLGLQVFPRWWSPHQLLAALCPRRKTSLR